MKLVWQAVAVGCFAAAAVQAWEVVDRISHFTTIAWKIGLDSSGVVSVGTTMIWVFFLLTGAFVAIGTVAQAKLRELGSPLRFLASVSVFALLAGALIWAGMLISPYVIIADR